MQFVGSVGHPPLGVPRRYRLNSFPDLAQHRDLSEAAPAAAVPGDVQQYLALLSVTGTVKPFAAAGRHVSYMCTTDRVGLLIRTHV
ncbi:hypothetical protein MAAFP003_5063 [Mycobacterium ahvazicum]|uniref:Uncharacterized protein n=1 Tax=Mycobacterium ahvazicum TaxID=1964395 RepID=A0A2K4YHU4_9MYCO|nr:hypothetical protein MAAFP003_5063 [Mycobacterium ahvazicum]